MPLFYFNIRDGRGIDDTAGTELPDLKAARREAISFSGAVIENEVNHLPVNEDLRLEVADETGLTLFVTTFSFTQSSAVPLF